MFKILNGPSYKPERPNLMNLRPLERYQDRFDSALRADSMSQQITLRRGKKQLTNKYQQRNIDQHEQTKKVSDKCLWLLHCTMVIDIDRQIKTDKFSLQTRPTKDIFTGWCTLLNIDILIFLMVPLTKCKDKWSIISQTGNNVHTS